MRLSLYCVDTSALIDGLERYYPEENFPGLWRKIDILIADGRFRISEEVWEELQQKDERAKEWAQPRLDMLFAFPRRTKAAGFPAAVDELAHKLGEGGGAKPVKLGHLTRPEIVSPEMIDMSWQVPTGGW